MDLKLAKKLAELMIEADAETRAVADMIVAITPTSEAEIPDAKPPKKQKKSGEKRKYTKRKALGTAPDSYNESGGIGVEVKD